MGLTRRQVILTKIEANYGTDPAPVGATNALLAYDIDFTPSGELLERPVLRPSISHLAHIVGLQEQSINFKCELKGDTTPIGTYPIDVRWHPLLMACGFSTAVTGTALSFVPTSQESSTQSVTIYLYADGNRHVLTGCRGNARINIEAGQFPFIEFQMKGLYTTAVTATTPTLSNTFDNVLPPIAWNSAFKIGAYAPITRSVVIDLRTNVTRRESLTAEKGVHSFRIADRNPQITWDADMVTEATNPFFTNWDTSVGKAFNIHFGSSAATGRNTIGISCPLLQMETIKYGDDDGVMTMELVGKAASSAPTGDDEMILYIC